MKKNKVINYILISIFIFILYIPTISHFFLKDYIKSDNLENRNLASKPELQFKSITDYPQLWDSYYNDNLPYRNYIVNNWRNINYILFRKSLDNRIIIGKNKKNETWLFYDNIEDKDEISYIDGRKKVNQAELDYTINQMKQQTQQLKKMNIDIYYIIGPNKSTVYSQNLPSQVNVKKDYFLKVHDYLKDNGINNLFYSVSILKKAGKKHETYYRTDTHWNDYGTYIYTKELIKRIYNKDIVGNQKIHEKYIKSTGKDLHNFTGLSLKILENNIEVSYSNNKIKKEHIEEDYGSVNIYKNKNYKLDETILLIGDSYNKALVKHLCAIYKKVIQFQINSSKYDEKVLRQYHLDKIFYIRVERSTPESLNFEFVK